MHNTKNILVVEDSDEDFESVLRAARKSGLQNPLIRCSTGDEALDYLFHRGHFAEHEYDAPGIILLDINLPGTDGYEVASIASEDPELKEIPIIMISTSTDPRDVEKCKLLGASCFIPKPFRMEEFLEAVNSLVDRTFQPNFSQST